MKYNTIVTILAFILLNSITARAQNSFLDSTFGNNGITTTESFRPNAMALQADGKILVGGSKLAATLDPILFRFNPDGSADATFGINGKVQLNLPNTENITDIAPLPDGQILVVGIRTVSGGGIIPTTSMIMFMRFDENGVPDTSIGDQGMVLTGFGTQRSYADKMILLPGGKIMISGSVPSEGMGVSRPALARFNADFTPDNSFNNTGYKVLSSVIGGFNTMAIDANGRIVAPLNLGGTTIKIYKFEIDGQIDDTFGINGVANITSIGGLCHPTDIRIAADGKLVICGRSVTNGIKSAFTLRTLMDGVADNNFGTSGFLTIGNNSSADEEAVGTVLLPDGKIITAIKTWENTFDYRLAFVTADGNLDTEAGTQGEIVTSLENDQYLSCIVQQQDGKLLAAGYGGANMTLVRYELSEILGINHRELAKIIAYPNPATDKVTITGLPVGTAMSLYNFSGQKLLDIMSNDIMAIDISKFPGGIYILKTVQGAVKIIKK